MESIERRDDNTGTDRAERRGSPREVPPPEAPQPDVLERGARFGA